MEALGSFQTLVTLKMTAVGSPETLVNITEDAGSRFLRNVN